MAGAIPLFLFKPQWHAVSRGTNSFGVFIERNDKPPYVLEHRDPRKWWLVISSRPDSVVAKIDSSKCDERLIILESGSRYSEDPMVFATKCPYVAIYSFACSADALVTRPNNVNACPKFDLTSVSL